MAGEFQNIREAVSLPRGWISRFARAMLYRVKIKVRKQNQKEMRPNPRSDRMVCTKPTPEGERAKEEYMMERQLQEKYEALRAKKAVLRAEQEARDRDLRIQAESEREPRLKQLLQTKGHVRGRY